MLLALVICAPPTSADKHPDVQQLLRQLQVKKTSANAEIQLIKLARNDPTTRHVLALQLPAIIAEDPNTTSDFGEKCFALSVTWCNAVDLAAELKLTEAVPALAKWIGLSRNAGIEYGNGEFFQHPAAIALAKIGDPAVPALGVILQDGDNGQRTVSMYALFEIDSVKSKAVLREYVLHGQDRGLASFIQNTLENVESRERQSH